MKYQSQNDKLMRQIIEDNLIRYPDEEDSLVFWLKFLKPHCVCGSTRLKRKRGERIAECEDCKRVMSVTAGTFLAYSKKPRIYQVAAILLTGGIKFSALKFSRMMEISLSSAILALKKIGMVLHRLVDTSFFDIDCYDFASVVKRRSLETPKRKHHHSEFDDLQYPTIPVASQSGPSLQPPGMVQQTPSSISGPTVICSPINSTLGTPNKIQITTPNGTQNSKPNIAPHVKPNPNPSTASSSSSSHSPFSITMLPSAALVPQTTPALAQGPSATFAQVTAPVSSNAHSGPQTVFSPGAGLIQLSPDEEAIYNLISANPTSTTELLISTGLPFHRIMSAIGMLELSLLIENVGGAGYRLMTNRTLSAITAVAQAAAPGVTPNSSGVQMTICKPPKTAISRSAASCLRDMIEDVYDGVSRKAIELYLALCWGSCDSATWTETALFKACASAGPITQNDIRSFVSAPIVRVCR